MRRMYYDYEQFCQKDGPDVFFVRDMEVVSAGTEIYYEKRSENRSFFMPIYIERILGIPQEKVQDTIDN